MKRITLTASAARLLENQITIYEDQQDPQTKKFLRDAKERRQWGRVVQAFDDTPNAFDVYCRERLEEGNKKVDAFREDQGKRIEAYLARWDEQGVDAALIATATSSLETLLNMRLLANQTAVNVDISIAQDDPAKGGALLEIDVDDTGDNGGVDFLEKTWEIIAGTVMSLEPRTRKQVNEITKALKNAEELVRVDGVWGVKTVTKPTLVKTEETG